MIVYKLIKLYITFTYFEPGSLSKACTMLLMAISFFGPKFSNPVMLKKAIPDIKVLYGVNSIYSAQSLLI